MMDQLMLKEQKSCPVFNKISKGLVGIGGDWELHLNSVTRGESDQA